LIRLESIARGCLPPRARTCTICCRLHKTYPKQGRTTSGPHLIHFQPLQLGLGVQPGTPHSNSNPALGRPFLACPSLSRAPQAPTAPSERVQLHVYMTAVVRAFGLAQIRPWSSSSDASRIHQAKLARCKPISVLSQVLPPSSSSAGQQARAPLPSTLLPFLWSGKHYFTLQIACKTALQAPITPPPSH
jgi:hypothetical protein